MTKRSEKMHGIAGLEEQQTKAQLEALRDVKPAGMVESWPIGRLVHHPDNPRALRPDSLKFRELVDSIRANGIYEPLTVRELADGKEDWRRALGVTFGQVLSGHRRLAAAQEVGLTHVPIRNLGRLDDAAAFDILAMANLHEDLTPLEEGKRAALWLDKYHEDAAAVASKLGKTPSWVVQHAQIARCLSAEWQREIAEAVDDEGRPKWRQWTAAHLAAIARLPVSLQAHYLDKTRKDYHFFCWPDLTVKKIEEEIRLDLLYLVKAPFEVDSCNGCVSRTDRQPLLWGETVEAATGDKARCLDKKCWDRKTAQAARENFKALVQTVFEDRIGSKGSLSNTELAVAQKLREVVPVSFVEEPEQTWGSKYQNYRQTMSTLKRTFPKLVTADQVQVVAEKTQGAVPGIVVAGKGKGSVKWVKITEKKKGTNRGQSYQPSAKELAQKKEWERWDTVCKLAFGEMCGSAQPSADVLLFMTLLMPLEVWGEDRDKVLREAPQRWAEGPDHFRDWIRDVIWLEYTREDGNDRLWIDAEDRRDLEALAPMFNMDLQRIYRRVKEAETAAAPPSEREPAAESPAKAKRGRPKKTTAAPIEGAAGDPPGASCDGDPRICGAGCKPAPQFVN